MRPTSYPECANEVEQRPAFVLASLARNACGRITIGHDPGDDPLGAIRGLLTALLIGVVLWLAFAWTLAKAFH
jgi:hypothetical protein